MSVKIVFLGPESTGKSNISSEVARLCKATFVAEFARAYLDEHGVDYTYTDVIRIAETQAKWEREAEALNNNMICDTDLITIKIWLEYYRWEAPEWMDTFILKHKADKYLLMYPDIPWMADEQRKNPHDRVALFNVFEQQLKSINANYSIIKGDGKSRLENCLKEVQKAMPN